MEIRTLTVHDIDAAADLTARVFGKPEQYAMYFELSRAANLHCKLTPPELCYALFDAGRLVAKWQLVDLRMRVLETEMRCVGALAVAAEPSAQGSDAVRRMFDAGYEAVQAQGFNLLLGIAQRGSIFHRLGGRPICPEPLWEMDALRVPAPKEPRFRADTPNDTPWIVDTYNHENRARSATLVRSAELYGFLLRRAPEVWIGSRGYVGIRRHADAIEVREIAARDPAFYDAALRELAEQARGAGVRRIFGQVPNDHPLVHASVPYAAKVTLEYARSSGCMVGVGDPQRFLDAIAPSLRTRIDASRFAGAGVRLTLHLEKTTCTLMIEGRSERTIHLELAMSTGGLLQLAFGYLPPRALLAAERSTHAVPSPALDDEQHALLDALFAQPTPFMWHTDRF